MLNNHYHVLPHTHAINIPEKLHSLQLHPQKCNCKSVHYALSQSCIDIIEDQIVRIIPFSSLFSQGRIDSDVVPDIRIWNDFGCI